MPSKVSRPPAGMFNLMGKVFLNPGTICSGPLAFKSSERRVAESQYTCRMLRRRRSSYTHLSRLLFSIHRSSALTSVASNSSLEDTVIVPLMLAPKEKELLGISNITVVFGFLNLLKKPTAFYLRLDIILKKKYLFMICVSLLLK